MPEEAPANPRVRRPTPRAEDGSVRVADSAIHGTGVLAARAFRRGETIGRFEGVPATRNGRFVLWVETDGGAWVGRRGTTALRYVNHSDRPNAAFHGWDLVALRRIRKGDEITVHYGEDATDAGLG